MLQVLRDNVAISPLYDPTETRGGIIIPDSAKERCDQGIVKYIGTDVKELQIGDYVVFSPFNGTNTHIEGEGNVIIMPEDKCVCVLHPPRHLLENVFFGQKRSFTNIVLLIEQITDILKDSILHQGLSSLSTAERIVKELKLDREYTILTYEDAIKEIANDLTKATWKSKYRFVNRRDAGEKI